jgi:hypothetical protein
MKEVTITKHAYDRAKERLGWKKATLKRMVDRVLEEGVTHKETNGQLRKYLNHLYRQKGKANNMRIYGDVIFVFHGKTLITIFKLPTELIKYVNK